MGRYSHNIKCLEIRKLTDNKQFKKALQILETIDLERVKSITDLNTFAEVYSKTERYEKAYELLMHVYEKMPSGRVLYKLTYLAIKMGRLGEAEEFYQQFIKEKPDGVERYLLGYYIIKAKKGDYAARIDALEKIKKVEYMEEWAYELAKLYHKAGMKEKCINECGDIVLWFGEGVIVEKAKLLKAYYTDGADILSAAQTGEKLPELKREIKVRARENRREKPVVLKMDTMDLANQVAVIAMEERKEERKRQLEEELMGNSTLEETMENSMVEENTETSITEQEIENSSEGLEQVRTENYEFSGKDSIETPVLSEQEEEDDEPEQVNEILYEMNEKIRAIFEDSLENPIYGEELKELLKQLEDKKGEMRIIFIGSDKAVGIDLAKKIARALNCMGYIDTALVAKITSKKINEMHLPDKQGQLENSTLLIESAGGLSELVTSDIISMMEYFKEKIVVILEDTEGEIGRLLDTYEDLSRYFPYYIHISNEKGISN